jgi:hypothetical protein
VCTLECNVALHVDTTTLATVPTRSPQKSAEDVPEDQMNVTKGLSEALNQSSEDIDISDFSPTSKGKPRCTSQYFKLLQFYYYIIYLALRLGVEMKP